MRIVYNKGHMMKVSEKNKMDILILRFSKNGPIRPLDIHNLNYASAASLIGLLVTYIIVLMQFRAVETCEDCANCNLP